MATKIDTFVTETIENLAEMRRLMERLAIKAQILDNRWKALGRDNIDGWLEYNWDAYPFTADELRIALNRIDNEQTATLLDLHTGSFADPIVKLGI